MAEPIGFIIITHSQPLRTIKLIERLNYMFDYPPIVCHHDFSKSILKLNLNSKNVSLVQPYIQTQWADFSVVEATIQAIKQMFGKSDSPDWFVLLSGSDYPIKLASKIIYDLNRGSFDAHIHYELIEANSFQRNWQRLCFQRYCTKYFTLPFKSDRYSLGNSRLCISHPLQSRIFLPFSKYFHCYAGSQWFSANRRAAKYIIQFHNNNHKLAAHYRKCMFPEESYFQSILANASKFRLNNNNWRYTDWSGGGAHPKTLDIRDLSNILTSSAHFARKIDLAVDNKIVKELDAIVSE